jgi:hypothetical protein
MPTVAVSPVAVDVEPFVVFGVFDAHGASPEKRESGM